MDQAERDDRASAIIADCLRRADQGQPIDPQEVIDEHPECAQELQSYFANEHLLANALSPVPSSTTGVDSVPESESATVSPGIGDSAPTAHRSFRKLPVEFGRYRVQKVLGQGAMGAVYLAHDTKLGRDVALKTPKLSHSEGGELVERFEREARAAAVLHHRNLCPVFDVGEIDGVHYLTMAYIDGVPLSAAVSRERPPSERQCAIVVRKLALALQEAHSHGVVHRDLKPANIMIDRSQEPVVMDFGLARQQETTDQSRLTSEGVILGSPAYMSPEQVEGNPDAVGPLTDIYSLGIILFELLTGQLPYDGSIVAILSQIISPDVRQLKDIRPGTSERLAAICSRMMAKKSSRRFPSMQAVADALESWLRDQKQAAARSGVGQDPALWAGLTEEPLSRAPLPGREKRKKKSRHKQAPGRVPRRQSEPSPEPETRQRKSAAHRKQTVPWLVWLLAGTAGAALLAGAIITLRDGTTIETSGQEQVTIETDPAGTVERITIEPTDATPQQPTEAQPEPPAMADSEYESLFNGRDLSGWRIEEGPGASPGWNVEYGEIVGRGKDTRLVSVADDFADFELRLECRIPRGANSGVHVRTRFGGGWKSGYEAQLSNSRDQETMTGGIFGLTVVKERLVEDDEWFRLAVRMVDRDLQVFVNGVRTSQATIGRGGPVAGAVSLQCWQSVGVRFRNIEIKRLNTANDNSRPSPGPAELLTSSDWEWSEPQFIGEFETDGNMDTLLTDELLTWVTALPTPGDTRDKPKRDIAMFTRKPGAARWDPPVFLDPPINGPSHEGGPALSADGQWLVFSSDRSGGAQGGEDLWICERTTDGQSWSAPVNLGPQVNSRAWEGQASFSPDGRTIYFASNRSKKGSGLWMTQRESSGAAWSPAEEVRLGGSTIRGLRPIISSDDRVMLFWSDQGDLGYGKFDLYQSVRDTPNSPWKTPANLGSRINTAGHEFPAALTNDGRLLLFRRIPPEGKEAEGHGFWSSRRVRKQQDRTATDEGGWVSLFNGFSLQGWHGQYSAGTDVWTVSNGELRSRSQRTGEKPSGWIATNDSFMNFDLELEYLMPKNGNSGVFLRAVPGKGRKGANQLEVQLLDDNGPRFRDRISDRQITGAIYDVAAPDQRADAPSGKWTRMRIRAVGDQIQVTVNGTTILNTYLESMRDRIQNRFQYDQPGPIGLQWHGDRVRFRNIRIRPLDAAGRPTDLPRSTNIFGQPQ